MRAFSYEQSYKLHRDHLCGFTLMILQYLFFSLAVSCIIMIVWMLMFWLQLAVSAALLLFAGAACKTGRQ